MTTTATLAVIGGITLILTDAARIPAALAEFLRACTLVAVAARELSTALAQHPLDAPGSRKPKRGSVLPAISAGWRGTGRGTGGSPHLPGASSVPTATRRSVIIL